MVLESSPRRNVERARQCRRLARQGVSSRLSLTIDDQARSVSSMPMEANVEEEVVLGGVVGRPLPDEHQAVGGHLEARDLVGVQGEGQGVLVEAEAVAQRLALGRLRGDEEEDARVLPTRSPPGRRRRSRTA